MTEDEWHRSRDPQPMLDQSDIQGRSRKFLLFAVACVRRVFADGRQPWWLDRALPLIDSLERHADGELSADEWDAVVADVLDIRHDIIDRTLDMLDADFCAVLTAIDNDPHDAAIWSSLNANIALSEFERRPERFEAGGTAEALTQVTFLRCVVGNPFRPVACDPRWRTATVVGLAETIYAGRAFDRLPILADALEEAGCDHPDVLAHCRGPGPHARGCWVVDLILGKA